MKGTNPISVCFLSCVSECRGARTQLDQLSPSKLLRFLTRWYLWRASHCSKRELFPLWNCEIIALANHYSWKRKVPDRNVRIFPNGAPALFQGTVKLEGAKGLGARTGGRLARNPAGSKCKRVPERSHKCLKRDGGWGAGRRGSNNGSPSPCRAHQSFKSVQAFLISLTSQKDTTLYYVDTYEIVI